MGWTRIGIWVLVIALAAWLVLGGGRGPEPGADLPLPGTFLQVENQPIYMVQKGQGRAILFLHGFPYHGDAFSRLWEQPWPGCLLLRFDLPGLGRSVPLRRKAPTPEDLALSIKLSLDHLDVKQVEIVGQGLGGGVGLILAAQYPGLVTRLVLLAPDGSAGGEGDHDAYVWRIPVLGELGAALWPVRPLVRADLALGWGRADRDWEQWVEGYAQTLSSWENREDLLQVRRGRYGFDYRPFEERLAVPTLVLWGDQDRVQDIARGRQWAAHLTGVRFRTLAGVGHLAVESAPGAVYTALQGFLNFAGSAPAPAARLEEPAPPFRPVRRSRAARHLAAAAPDVQEAPTVVPLTVKTPMLVPPAAAAPVPLAPGVNPAAGTSVAPSAPNAAPAPTPIPAAAVAP